MKQLGSDIPCSEKRSVCAIQINKKQILKQEQKCSVSNKIFRDHGKFNLVGLFKKQVNIINWRKKETRITLMEHYYGRDY